MSAPLPTTPAETFLSYAQLCDITQDEISRHLRNAERLEASNAGYLAVQRHESLALGAVDLLFAAGLACRCAGDLVEQTGTLRASTRSQFETVRETLLERMRTLSVATAK